MWRTAEAAPGLLAKGYAASRRAGIGDRATPSATQVKATARSWSEHFDPHTTAQRQLAVGCRLPDIWQISGRYLADMTVDYRAWRRAREAAAVITVVSRPACFACAQAGNFTDGSKLDAGEA